MREYFNVGTPKYYKVSISNPKRLLEELVNYINTTEWGSYIQSEHITYLIEEYLYRSSKDIIYKQYNNIFKEFHTFLIESLWKENKSINSMSKNKDFVYFIDELKNRINPIIRNLKNSYFKNSKKQLLDILNKKEEEIKLWDFTSIKKICYSFSTEILRIGYSRYYIYENINNFLICDKVDFNCFIDLFDEEINDFSIYFKVINRNKDIINIFKNKYWEDNIFIEEFPFLLNEDFSNKNWVNRSIWKFLQKNKEWQNSFWLRIDKKWIDYISTWNIILKEINTFLDEIRFEYTNDRLLVYNNVISKDEEWNINFINISDSLNIHRKWSSIYFFNEKNKKVKEIYESEEINNSTKEKIKTIFRFYRYFLESDTLEHKFLNLWIWWEHIFSLNFKRDSQTWKNIHSFYPLIDSLSIVEDILKDMVQVQLKRSSNKKELNKILTDNDTYIVTNLYKILKEKGNNWNNLFKCNFLDKNDLVKVKLFRLHEQFKSPQKFVEKNKNKVKWNLYRLYRVRNAIVHRWNIESLGLPIEMLISDLETYYTNLLDVILNRFSANNRFESIEQLFISIKKTYNSFQNEKGISKINDTKEIKKKLINLPLIF